ncbi:unnamed protein product, partial [Cladocopium goreaui]
ADVPLTDFLLQRWPSFFSTSSVARRTVARGRVWMAEEVVQSGAPGAELGPLRQAWWSESIKGKTILFVPDYPRRSPHETKLVVLWEDDHLAVVVKEPGLRLFGGIRTLANMLAAKEEGASLHPSKEEDALPAPVPLHFLEAEIGGCVLVAKTARAALQGLSSPSRCFQGLFVTGGVLWDEAKLLAATGWTLRRMEPSVRFGHLLAAERGAAEHSAAALRCSAAELAAANGAPALLGDVEFGGEEAPRIRRNQLFLVVSRWHLRQARSQIAAAQERDFLFADNLEPHATRRNLGLGREEGDPESTPRSTAKTAQEITKLMGPEWRTKYLVAATVALQITLACFAKSWSFWTFLAGGDVFFFVGF